MAVNLISYAGAAVGPVTAVDTAKRNPLGLRCFGSDGGEYIYLQGVASTVAGDWVVYGQAVATPFVSARAVHTTANTGPVAVAQAAILASQFGWYMIYGVTAGNTANDTFAANHYVYLTSTAGVVDDDAVATDIIYGASSLEVGAAVSVNFFISYPFVLGVQPA